jgi:hypothetical protein
VWPWCLLGQVTLLEAEDSVFHLRNLSQHLATYVGAHSQPSVSWQSLLCMADPMAFLDTLDSLFQQTSRLTPKGPECFSSKNTPMLPFLLPHAKNPKIVIFYLLIVRSCLALFEKHTEQISLILTARIVR